MITQIELYKIFNKETCLYSKGGIYCANDGPYTQLLYWSKKGKVWTSQGALRRHLQQYETIPPEWEVFEYKSNPKTGFVEVKVYDASKFYHKTYLQ